MSRCNDHIWRLFATDSGEEMRNYYVQTNGQARARQHL